MTTQERHAASLQGQRPSQARFWWLSSIPGLNPSSRVGAESSKPNQCGCRWVRDSRHPPGSLKPQTPVQTVDPGLTQLVFSMALPHWPPSNAKTRSGKVRFAQIGWSVRRRKMLGDNAVSLTGVRAINEQGSRPGASVANQRMHHLVVCNRQSRRFCKPTSSCGS